MNNNQKLEFILKLERRDKRKKIIKAVLLVLVLGAILIFAQYMNFDSVKQ